MNGKFSLWICVFLSTIISLVPVQGSFQFHPLTIEIIII